MQYDNTPHRAHESRPVAASSPAHLTADRSFEPLGMPAPGDRIGKYELIRKLGAGGMGTVFLARDIKLGRRVAIKFLKSQNAEQASRFILEARATARFQHDNIIVIYEVDDHLGMPFMVLEYLEGTPLSEPLEGQRTMTPHQAVDIMLAVVRALERAHENNIVHRDLKPDNIFLTHDGRVKVLDFGIAKVMHEEPAEGRDQAERLAGLMTALEELESHERADDGHEHPSTDVSHRTRQGAIVGTLPYMSPEQWGIAPVDHRSDIWACGILLFRMLTGQHPLGHLRGPALVVTAILDEPMPRVRDVAPHVPEDLADVIDHCLIKDRERRMPSATALIEALEQVSVFRSRSQTFRTDRTPYTGLSSFQEGDADKFFGRANEVMAATSRLQHQPLMAIVGPSGVGKSSFVRAGLVPALKRSGEAWSTVVLRPGRDPMSALAQVVAPMIGRHSTQDAAAELAELGAVRDRLFREPGYAGAVLRNRARRKERRYLLFVDQFEELYTLVPDRAARIAFTRCLAGVADDATAPLRVVISIRSDFLDRVPEDGAFMAQLSQGLFFLMPPARDGLRDALVQPAEMVGYQFERPEMVEHMLDHLETTPGALPLLQFAASKLWELRDDKRRLLTDESYRAMGGIVGAMASHADAVLAELPRPLQNLARAVFVRLVTPERTRAIVSVDELRELVSDADAVQQLLDHLVQARLLVVQTGDGTASVEIVHESLIHSWPLLRRWLDENQDDAAFLEQLRTAAKQWQAKGYAPGLLWRGEAMDEARGWHRRYRGTLPELQQRYLDAVFALASRGRRRKRIISIAFVVLMCGFLAAATIALIVIRDAQTEAVARAAEADEARERAQFEAERARAASAIAEAEREKAETARRASERQAEEIARQNQALERANEKEIEQREQAETAKRRARQAARRARRDAERARNAEEEATRLSEQLAEKLEDERKLRAAAESRNSLLLDDLLLEKPEAREPRRKRRKRRNKRDKATRP